MVEDGKAFQRCSEEKVILPQLLLANIEGSAQELFHLGGFFVQYHIRHRQPELAFGHFQVARPEGLFANGQRPLMQPLGFFKPPFVAVEFGQNVQGGGDARMLGTEYFFLDYKKEALKLIY